MFYVTVLQKKIPGWRQIVSPIQHFHSKAVSGTTQIFPTRPVSPFLPTWPASSYTNFRRGRVDPPNIAPKQTSPLPTSGVGVRPAGNIAARKNFAPPLFFGAHETFSIHQGAHIKTFVSDLGRASFSAKQTKNRKQTWSFPVTPQCATRRFRLTKAFC